MRLWALLAVLLLSSLVLAGCSDGGDDDDDATSSSSTSTSRSATTGATTSGTSTSGSTTSSQPGQPGQEPSNTAPVGSMAIAPVANATQAFNFTLNGTDPEGDNIVWDLLFGDGQSTAGTVLPATAGHTYRLTGLYNATFTISDGRLQTTYNLTVNVTSGGASFTPIHQEGAVTALCPQCSAPHDAAYDGCIGMKAAQNGQDCFFFAIPPEAAGRLATAVSSNGFVNYLALADCSGLGAGLQNFVDPSGSSPYTFAIPEGTGCLAFYEWADLPPSLVVDIV